METPQITAIIGKYNEGKRFNSSCFLTTDPYTNEAIFIAAIDYDPSQSDEDYGEHIYALYFPYVGGSPDLDVNKVDFLQLRDKKPSEVKKILNLMTGENSQ